MNGQGDKKAGAAGQHSPRPLLNLNSGGRRGLERVFGRLAGLSRPGPPDTVLSVFRSLDFVISDSTPAGVTHPLAPGRQATLPAREPAWQTDPEGWALDFAAAHFQEMEFYLPYIMRRAAHRRRQATSGSPANSAPEPDYDDDGFLAGYQA